MNPITRLLIRSQRIDRRALYVLLVAVLSLPFITHIPVPPPVVSPQTQSFYDTIEGIAKDPVASKKLVIISSNFDAGTTAESLTQCTALMRHLMQRHLKFAIFDFTFAPGRELAQGVMDTDGPRFGYVYGRDYVNWGFRPSAAIVPLLKAAVHDVPGAVGKDIHGTPLADVPVMKDIKTVDDISLIVEITASDTVSTWFQYYQRAGKTPIPTLYCPTRVMAPQAYPFLKSGQLQGMLSGLNGTIEYEGLIHETGFATQASASLSYSNVLIIALIILGNAGMFALNREERRHSGRVGGR